MKPEKSSIEALRIDRSRESNGSVWNGWLVGLILLLLLLAAAGYFAYAQRAVPVVRALTVRASAVNGVMTVLNASGYVTARRQATVSSKVTGKVMEVMVEEGLAVKEGQLLARLDETNLKTSLDLASAQLASSRSALKETKVRIEQARLESERIGNLWKNQIASASELDRAKADYDSLVARLDSQQVEITVAERQVAVWQQQMEDTVIRAPFAGMVVSKNAQPGEMISPISAGGGFTRTGICTIVDMESLEIENDVNESHINRVSAGQPVVATLDAYPDWKIPAKVIAIIPTADRQKATVKVRVGFLKLDPRILPDMSVKVAFQETAAESSPLTVQRQVLLPRSAVRKSDGKDVVYLVNEGRAERRAITVGAVRDEEVTVMAGLQGGERVILSGPDRLADGDRVKEQP